MKTHPHTGPVVPVGVYVAVFAALLILTVLALLVWPRLPVLSLVAGGGAVGIVARSKLIHRVRELT